MKLVNSDVKLIEALVNRLEPAAKLAVIEVPPSDDPGRFEIWTDEFRVWVHPISRDVCVQLYQSGFTMSQGEGLAAAIIAAVEDSYE